jgi:hypothetical protein
MRALTAIATLIVVGSFFVSDAQAACSGTNGRGWASGKGAGQFTMTQTDQNCRISFPGFMKGSTRIPATEVAFTRQPKSGKVTIVSGQGLIYAPAKGFKGKDTFCTRNKSPRMPGQTLSGCVTVTVK